jgi:hypothetical protein
MAWFVSFSFDNALARLATWIFYRIDYNRVNPAEKTPVAAKKHPWAIVVDREMPTSTLKCA